MATDTEAEREAVAQEPATTPDEAEGGDAAVRELPRWAIPLAIVAFLAVLVLVGRAFGVGPAILVLAATALLVVVGFLFRAVQAAAEPHEDDERDALPPTLAEEQKRAALRALKELEFEKSVGNISPEDYEVIVGRYREEAKRAMRAVDEERKTMRERAEKIAKKAVAAEVGAVGLKNPFDEPVKNPFVKADDGGGGGANDEAPIASDEAKPKGNACAKCAVINDDDAKFCKACGTTIGDVA